MNFPGNLRYTDHDEWFLLEGDICTVGITDFAQDALGELVHVELPEVGATFSVGAAVCEVESVKAVAEVYTAVGGEIVEINGEIEDAAEIVNQDPYGKGWLFKIRVSDPSALAKLHDVAAYRKKIGK